MMGTPAALQREPPDTGLCGRAAIRRRRQHTVASLLLLRNQRTAPRPDSALGAAAGGVRGAGGEDSDIAEEDRHRHRGAVGMGDVCFVA